MKYVNLVEETNDSNKQEREKLANDIKTAIEKIFPKSMVQSEYSEKFGTEMIMVRFALGKDKNEWANGILQNDDAFSVFSASFERNGIVIESSNGFSISVKPDEGSHLAMGRVKVPFRKTTVKNNDHDKVVKTFEKTFNKLKDVLKKNKENLFHPKYAQGKF